MQNVIELATAQFKLDIDGTHGLRHWQQVEVNGLLLAQQTGANTNVVRHFAYLHDACRDDEHDDPEHGRRAALWMAKLWGDGHLQLSNKEFMMLESAIRLHNRGLVDPSPTIGTCWDADRFDLVRCGVIPAERFMSTSHGKQLAKEIYEHPRTKTAPHIDQRPAACQSKHPASRD